MRKYFFVFISIFLTCSFLSAKPVFTQAKYLIGCLQAGGVGTVGIGALAGGVDYPLAFYSSRDGDSAIPSDYWIVKELTPGEYCFQNELTLKYIKYDNTASSERTALVLVDQLQSDRTTNFTLELKQVGNLCYYVIRCATNPVKGWNKRSIINGIYPVGVYNVGGVENESFIFYSAGGTSVIDDGKDPVILPTAGPSLGAFKNAMSMLSFSDKVPVVDLLRKEFYLSIPEAQMGTNVPMTVSYALTNSAHKLYVNNVLVNTGSVYTFPMVQAGKTYPIEVRNGATSVVTGTIVFSTLPLVQIYSDSEIQYVYSLGRVVVTEPDKSLPSEVQLSELRYRGATAAGAPKKAYALKLKNPIDGTSSLDRSYLGLRSDNNWILDAMYIDPARMRNRVSTDLWNDFSTPPYFKPSEATSINGTRGAFVEVFLNDSYNGLYCMTEKIDRKQLKVKKVKVDELGVATQHGGMYKASSWSIGTLLGNGNWGSRNGVLSSVPTFSNNSETWSAFEVKYPDFGDGEPIGWKPLYDAVVMSSHLSSNANFVANVANYYDLPVFLDYYLFIDLMLATDNHGKNTYLSVYDQAVSPKMTITPWDLDGTWGRRWDGSSDITQANQSFVTYINQNEWMENNLCIRLRQLNVGGYNAKLKSRYAELRGTFFTHPKLMERFQKYLNQFKVSGAATREMNRWSVESFDAEIAYLSTWIQTRLNYLDIQYLGKPYVAGVNDVSIARVQISPTLVRDQLTVSNLNAGEAVEIVSLQGILVGRYQANDTRIVIDMNSFSAGIYLVKVKDSTTKVVKI